LIEQLSNYVLIKYAFYCHHFVQLNSMNSKLKTYYISHRQHLIRSDHLPDVRKVIGYFLSGIFARDS